MSTVYCWLLRFYSLGFQETGSLTVDKVAWLVRGMMEIVEVESGGGSGANKRPEDMTAAEKIEMYRAQGKISD